MARPKKVETESSGVGVVPSFEFFQSMKTGNKYADGNISNEIPCWIDTGCYSLNAQISGDLTKGIPGNRVIMLAGEEASGKTFFAVYNFARPLARDGYFIFYFDTENAMEDSTLLAAGLPEGSFKILPVDTIDECKFQMMEILDKVELGMGKGGLINRNKCAFVLDSQGMLDSSKARADIKKKVVVGDMTPAKSLKSLYKAILRRLGNMSIPMCVTNHVYADPGAYVPTKKVAGGSGGLYAASVILLMGKRAFKVPAGGDKKVRVGTLLLTKNVKSRLTRENIEAMMYLNYDRGLNKWYGLHAFALEAGLIVPMEKEKHQKAGVVLPEKPGNFNWVVVCDPKIPTNQWIVCKETEVHTERVMGSIFNEMNEFIKKTYQLHNPIDFSYDQAGLDSDEDEDLPEDSDIVEADTEDDSLSDGSEVLG